MRLQGEMKRRRKLRRRRIKQNWRIFFYFKPNKTGHTTTDDYAYNWTI